MTPKPRLLFLVTEDWYFWTHRRSIAKAALAAGYDVSIATHIQHHGERIEQAGLRVIPIRLRRKSWNPIAEILSIADLVAIYRREKPDIVHQVGLKPVLYGTLAARIAHVPAIVNALAGLGHVCTARELRYIFLKRLIFLALGLLLDCQGMRLILQTDEDRETLTRHIIDSEKTVLIPGSGANTDDFRFSPVPSGIPVVMFAGRLLWSKGVGNLVEASRRMKARGIECRVVIVGDPDVDNPSSIPEQVLLDWQQEGLIEWWGLRDDMPAVLLQATIIALPSQYGEGVPKILLEAAAVGRPIIATDIPGCRAVVRHGINGLLIPPGDDEALVAAIVELSQDRERCLQMGKRGRENAEKEFSEELVVEKTFSVYRGLLNTQLSKGLFR